MQRILVIDDDPAVCSFLRRGLSYQGFEVATAGSGPEGLREFERSRPALVILDVMMPQMDGLEVLRAIRQKDPACAVLLFSGKDSEESVQEGLEAGASDYLIKPASFHEIVGRVRRLLSGVGQGHP
ncbi:response regulator transcription factor [Calidithermus chliarophilus]|uniref:response regulator transcription factor n=1 Tax=Calidithermus chliarophilus TaxID=52023 RepID=UPI000A03ECEA|nr:response regulator [Calidithermus chliarophilus]